MSKSGRVVLRKPGKAGVLSSGALSVFDSSEKCRTCCCHGPFEYELCFFYQRGGGHSCQSAVFDVRVNDVIVGRINLNNSSDVSVFGGSFSGTTNSKKLKVELACALSSCHEDITTFGIIVKNGENRVAVKPNGRVYRVQEYSLCDFEYIYKAAHFEQVDNVCVIITES